MILISNSHLTNQAGGDLSQTIDGKLTILKFPQTFESASEEIDTPTGGSQIQTRMIYQNEIDLWNIARGNM